ncbi:MAG: hypothetical protein K8L99_31650, partial [Anaerolineae bacterium]|nr:hypothetical protein [Anaerolineae bacterium]
ESPTPSQIHVGRDGESPRVRALMPQYDWPHYTLPAQIAIGENGASGSVAFAMNFWRNSSLHKGTALNPIYREVGVAAIPNKNGHFFLMVFGSRPNVLPTLTDPTRHKLYLSNEEFQYAAGFDSISDATRYRLFDADGRPLSDTWQVWANTVDIPDDAGDKVYVLYSDGNHEALSEVDLGEDVALLPGGSEVVIAPTTVPSPTIATKAPEVVETVTATPVATEVPTETEAPVQPTPAPTAAPANPDILLIYTSDTLSILNVSGGPLDLTGIEIGSGDKKLPISQFARVADISLAEIPNNHCVQARDVNIQGGVDKPASCSWVRSLLYIVPENIFWATQDFTIRRDNVTLATCTAGAGECAAALP